MGWQFKEVQKDCKCSKNMKERKEAKKGNEQPSNSPPKCSPNSSSIVGRDWGRLEGWGRLCFRPQSNPPAMAIKYSLLTA